ncbi:MAG: PT domain-containing protein [Chloroflexota bacterium]
MRRAIGFALPGIVLILIVLGLHALIQRQLQGIAPTLVAPTPTAAPAIPSAVPSVAPTQAPTLAPTAQPTASPVATARPTNTVPPQATATPAPPPTATPTPGPIVTNDKLGVGIYTSAIPTNVLQTLRPAMILIQDPDPHSVGPLRKLFPKALIVGRHYVPDGDFTLAHCSDPKEDHYAKGVAFADMLAHAAVPLKNIVNAWVSDNEQATGKDPTQLTCHAQFQAGFVETLQGKYQIDAVAGNEAVAAVEPSDYAKYFAKPISEAKYFGVHAYGKPETLDLQTDSQYYALRYRSIHDELVKAGVPLPTAGFLLTESGYYQGWRGYVSDQKMANDFIWLEQETEKDSYVKGQFIFGIGPQGRFGNYEIMGTTLLQLLGQFNAQHAGTP